MIFIQLCFIVIKKQLLIQNGINTKKMALSLINQKV